MTASSAIRILIPLGQNVNKANLIRSLQLFSGIVGARIVLLHVVALPQTVTIDPAALSSFRENAENRFRDVVQWLREQDFAAELKVAGARSIVDGIVEEAESGEYKMIIIQKTKKRGLSKIGNVIRRSTSERLLSLTSTPLLIVPP